MLTGIRNFIILLLLVSCGSGSSRKPVAVAEDSTFLTGTFFLVRHAEKNPGVDSTLTAAGHARAHTLYTILKDSGLQKVYFTPFKRTMQTAAPLLEQLRLDTAFYMPDTTGESLVYEITRHGDWGKRLLIVGHSNTLLPVMRALSVRPPVDSIGDRDYSYLFIVYKTMDTAVVRLRKY